MTDARLVHDAEGLNAGSRPVAVASHFITPLDRFFTRSHAPVPAIDVEQWRLEIGGLVARRLSFSLKELLGTFPRRRLAATLVCAGLRRIEYLAQGPLPGELPWGPEPVSTGEWGGVALRDVLEAAGAGQGVSHVEFVGLDRVERKGKRFGFGGSIDLDKAMSPDVLLATELNGAPLPPAHGFPMRTVVPGWIGARSVKWLGRITLLAGPSENYFQTQAYRVQREAGAADPRDVSAGVPLSEVPLNAVIAEPAAESVVPPGPLTLRGWAMGGAGRPLRDVEVSPNGGADWIPARITVPGGAWTWSFWEAAISLAPGRHTLVARATDAAGARQPPNVSDTWNVKGYGNNAWHRVAVLCAA